MIGIIIALKSEAKYFIEKIKNVKETSVLDKKAYTGEFCGKEIVLAISGIGKVSAALTAQKIIDDYSPEYLLNFGSVGAVNDAVGVLDYCIVDRCMQYDFDVTALDPVPLGYIQEYDRVFFDCLTAPFNEFKKASLATGDRFSTGKEDAELVSNQGCALRDMEGAAIAQVCESNKVPLIMLKGVSDVYGSESEQEQFVKNLDSLAKGFPEIIEKIFKKI